MASGRNQIFGTGRARGWRGSTALRAVVVALTVGALTTGTAQATPAAHAASHTAPTMAPAKSIAVTPVVSHYQKPEPMPNASVPAPVWPSGTATAALPAAGATSFADLAAGRAQTPAAPSTARAGSLPIWVGAPAAAAHIPAASAVKASASATVPSKVSVRILPRSAAQAVGVNGLLITVGRADGSSASGRVHLALGYESFATAFGGDWASRLRLTSLPACVLTTPQVPACRAGTPVAAVNSSTTQQLSADVTLPGAATATRSATKAAAVAAPMVLAASSAAGGGGGDFTQTSLKPSSSWQAGGSTDAFSWSYPFQAPAVPGGLAPQLALNYDSQSLDGLTSSTNDQASVVGDGFSLPESFIERSYASCHQNPSGPTQSDDNCWTANNQLTLSMNGQNSTLIPDNTTADLYHPQNDSNERVQYETGATNGAQQGEYWVVTTADGVQYTYGLNRLPGWASGDATTNSVLTEPIYSTSTIPNESSCYNATFADSHCDQAYRWMLDYVKDPRGDAMSYFYTPTTGYYAMDMGKTATAASAYMRDVSLAKIEYGQRDGSAYTTSPAAQITFSYNGRCNTSSTGCATSTLSSTASTWPDVPYDQNCASGAACTVNSPTFWSENELTGIQTQVLVGSTETNVDSWAFTYSFPPTGDATTPSLWLNSIVRTGQDISGGGSTTTLPMPAVTFSGQTLSNRVNLSDGYPPITRYRLNKIITETGEVINVDYSSAACASGTPSDPSQNTTLCYPDYWTPSTDISGTPIEDWFNKYIVTAVSEQDPTGGGVSDTITTRYVPVGNPAWHYDDNPLTPASQRTWDDWRGYQTMQVSTGNAPDPITLSQYTYFRGMNGDTLPSNGTRSATVTDTRGDPTVTDLPQYAGMTYETVVYNGYNGTNPGPVVSDTVTDPWSSAATATHALTGLPSQQSFITGTADTKVYTPLAAGGTRETETDYTHDAYGRLTQTNSLGDVSTASDDHCTTTSYADNTTAWILDAPDEVKTVSVNCSTTPTLPADAVSDTRTFYDGSTTFGAAPTVGDATMTQAASSYTGSTPNFTTMGSKTMDEYGRVLTSTDADNRTTTTAYTPATGAAPTATTITDPMGHVSSATLDPLRGLPLTTTDAAGYVTSGQYDALGRTTAEYLPGITPAAVKYTYMVSNSAPSTVVTQTLNNDGSTYRSTETLYDALLRTRETQTSTEDGGRDVVDTVYNTAGLTASTTAPYYNSGVPSGTLVQAQVGKIPSETGYTYDDAGRQTTSTAYALGTATWDTQTVYNGSDITTTIPPAGGTAQSVVTNALGQTTDLYQYKAGVTPDPVNDPASDYTDTHYTYTSAGKQASETDAAGNAWSWGYNLLGQQTSTQDPDAGASSSTYDNAGQLLTATDARGKQTSYTYDLDGRKTATYDTTGGVAESAADQVSAWTYDTLKKGMPTASTSYQMGTTSPSETSTVLAYNSYGDAAASKTTLANLPTDEAALAPSAGYTTSYAYNTAGNPLDQEDPASGGLPAETINYGYDSYGQPTSVGSSLGDYVSALGYDEYGNPLLYTMGTTSNWASLALTYDPQTDAVTNAETTDSTSSTVVDNTSYNWGTPTSTPSQGSGLLLSTTDAQSGGTTTDTQCFQYDGQQHLTQAWTATDNCATTPSTGSSSTVGGPSPYWQSWTYTADGQRASETDYDTTGDSANDTTISYNYPAADSSSDQPHTLASTTATGPAASANTANYTYDADGNTLSISGGAAGEQSMNWNDQDKLASDNTVSGTSTYLYDTSGNLILRTDPGTATLFIGDEQIVENTGTLSLTATRYYSIGGTTIAERSNTGDVQYLIPDRQGTDTLAIDAGTIQTVTRRQYTPFGQVRGTAPASWPGDNGYVGGTTDPTTNLENLGAREYDPTTGRFISPDPVLETTDPTQLSGYDYAGNNPTTKSDPTGAEAGYCVSLACEEQTPGGWGGVTPPSAPPSAPPAAAPVVYVQISPTVAVQDTGDGLVQRLQKLYQHYFAQDYAHSAVTMATLPLNMSMGIWDQICGTGICDSTVKDIVSGEALTTQQPGAPVLFLNSCGFEDRCSGGSHGMMMGAAEGDSGNASIGVGKAAGSEVEATCLNSFSPDTDVLMANGKAKPIGLVKIGDKVASADPTTGKFVGARAVTAAIVHEDDNLIDVTVRGGRGGRIGTLQTTAEHLFWDATDRLWVPAGDLIPGHALKTNSTGRVYVAAVRDDRGSELRYNLTVLQLHTYYVEVAGTPILVHNSCGDLYDNKMPATLSQELSVAERLGASPTTVGTPEFDEALNSGDGRIKWAVLEDGSLVVMAKFVSSIEISHAVLSGGAPVRAAGEADISGSSDLGYFGTMINAHSGHYFEPGWDDDATEIGRGAFSEQGVDF